MTSFLTNRAHVHDARLPLRRRHSALRNCITLFAPYGFRATYHHLTLSAAIPRRLEADPDSLVRAVEELFEARVLWLARGRSTPHNAGRTSRPGVGPFRTRDRGGCAAGGTARTVPGTKTRSAIRRCDCLSTSGGRTRS